jgi:hypothetical protein
MVVWGTIVALTCLVNSYRGLIMYAIRTVHLDFRSSCVAPVFSLDWLKEDSFPG